MKTHWPPVNCKSKFPMKSSLLLYSSIMWPLIAYTLSSWPAVSHSRENKRTTKLTGQSLKNMLGTNSQRNGKYFCYANESINSLKHSFWISDIRRILALQLGNKNRKQTPTTSIAAGCTYPADESENSSCENIHQKFRFFFFFFSCKNKCAYRSSNVKQIYNRYS